MKKSSARPSGKSAQFVDSSYGNENTGPTADKKYEGYSNLKGKSVKEQARAKKAGAGTGDGIETEYIEVLQKQVATMESQIKLLKDKEVDQKNQAAGYETLLRDGIPLNEHFLSLKNKYNKEEQGLRTQRQLKEDEIAHHGERNDQKKRQIDNLKRESEIVKTKLQQSQFNNEKKSRDMENSLYSQQHNKTVMLEDRKVTNTVLQQLRGENAQTDRVLKQQRNFTGKRDKLHKDMRETEEDLIKQIGQHNEKIQALTWEIDQWKRKLADKTLPKKLTEEVLGMRQRFSMATININTGKARLEDLNGQKEMAMSQLRDLLAEKLIVDEENEEFEAIIRGKGMSEPEMKELQKEAERERTNRLNLSLNNETEEGEALMERLKEEEARAKEQLDAKINAEQETEIVVEDAAVVKGMRRQNREELIRMQIRQSQLKSGNMRTDTELNALKEKDANLIKSNDEMEEKIANLDQKIGELIQRVDLNTLLKEVDLEELRLIGQSNTSMNMGFMQLLSKWEAINGSSN